MGNRDLIVSRVMIGTPNTVPHPGDQVHLGVEITNQGNESYWGTNPMRVEWKIGGALVGAATRVGAAAAIAPGKKVTVWADTPAFWTAGAAGDYGLTATVDPSNLIPEVDDTNNSRSLAFTVVDPTGGGTGGGGNGGGTTPGTRPMQDSPGDALLCPANVPLGADVAVDAHSVNADGSSRGHYAGRFFNGPNNTYGRFVWGGNAPEKNITPPGAVGNPEGHRVLIGQACGHAGDRRWARHDYRSWDPANPNHMELAGDLAGSLINSPTWAKCPGNVNSWGRTCVAGFSDLFGLLRLYDLTKGAVLHAMTLSLGESILGGNPKHTWPAIGEDQPNNYAGYCPIGSRVFIRWSEASRATSPIGHMIETGLRTHGAYIKDRRFQGPCFDAEANCWSFTHSSGQTFGSFATSQECQNITALLVRATNCDQTNPGGPGVPRALIAPPFA